MAANLVGRIILAAFLGAVVITAAVVVGRYSSGNNGRSTVDNGRTTSDWTSAETSSFTSSETAEQSQSDTDVSTTAATTQSSSSPSYSMSMFVNQTIVDSAQACAGSADCSRAIYILNITVRNTGTQDTAFNELNLRLVTDNGSAYATYPIVYAIDHPASGSSHAMPSPVNLSPGRSSAGEEGFMIPSSATPVTLTYRDWNLNASAAIPRPSSWVSEVVTVGDASVSPEYLACTSPDNSQVQSCYTASFEGLNSSILGSADYFTGEVMGFRITIFLGKGPSPGPEPGTVAVQSTISSFFVKHVSAPQCVGGDSTGCTSWAVEVYLVPQPGLSYYGSPELTVILPPS